MDENSSSEAVPDLKDIEGKIGRKTPEGLLRWMREEATSLRGDAKLTIAHDASKETGKRSLDEKIRKLKIEMVRVLQALFMEMNGLLPLVSLKYLSAFSITFLGEKYTTLQCNRGSN